MTFSLRSSVLPWSSLSVFITSILHFLSHRSLFFILSISFPGVLFFHLECVSFSPHFGWVPVFVFMVLCRFAMSSGLGKVALYCRYPRRPSGTVSLFTWAGCSSDASCVCPPIVVEPRLLLTCHWVGLTLRLTSCEAWPWLLWTSWCAGLTPASLGWLCLGCVASSGFPQVCHFEWWFEWFSGVFWSQPPSMLVLEPLGRGSSEVQLTLCQAWGCLVGAIKLSAVNCHCAGLGNAWEHCAVNQSQLPLAPGLGPFHRHSYMNWGQPPVVLVLWLLCCSYVLDNTGCSLSQTCGYLMGVPMGVENSHYFCQAWGHFTRNSGYGEASTAVRGWKTFKRF